MFNFNFIGKQYQLELLTKDTIRVTPRNQDARTHALLALEEVTYGEYFPTIPDLLKALSDELEGDYEHVPESYNLPDGAIP